MLNGKLGRLLRKGALSLSFAAAALIGAGVAITVSRHNAPQASAVATTAARLPATADPHASPATRAVFNYLSGLQSQPSHRLISGQWTGYGKVDTVELQRIEKMTGRRVGLVGADYLDFSGPGMGISTGSVNASMIDYWNQGALVDIDVHMPNPWAGHGLGDRKVPNFAAVITPGTPAYQAYMANLDKIAEGLQQLQDAGVTVLFRPMMEMDGDWFWWGRQPEFPKLWIQTFDYLTNTKGLHNLLWVYAAGTNKPLSYYPGSQYVDIVGYDAYSYGTRGGKARGYTALLKTGKPFALAELGLQSSAYRTKTEPPYDLHKAVTNVRTHMPEAVYFMAWSNARGEGNNYWGIDAQRNAAAALNDDWVQNNGVPWKPSAAAGPSKK